MSRYRSYCLWSLGLMDFIWNFIYFGTLLRQKITYQVLSDKLKGTVAEFSFSKFKHLLLKLRFLSVIYVFDLFRVINKYSLLNWNRGRFDVLLSCLSLNFHSLLFWSKLFAIWFERPTQCSDLIFAEFFQEFNIQLTKSFNFFLLKYWSDLGWFFTIFYFVMHDGFRGIKRFLEFYV